MAKKLQQYFTFDPTLKRVFIRGIFNLDQILLINNVTRGKILFALGSPALGIAAIDHVENSSIFVDGHNLERHTMITLNAADELFTGMLSTDELQIFTEDDHVKIEPSETFMDPVMKMRVSTPQNLIDTDFEYGLQATKWETLETLNNIPAFFIKNGETSLGDIARVDSVENSRIITVTTVAAHGLTPGAPFEIRGLNEITAEGTYLVKAVPTSTTFTYEARVNQQTTAQINNSYTVVFPGQFYSASQITIDNSTGAGIATDGEIGSSTLTVNTRFPHGFPVTNVNPAAFYIVNAIAGRTQNFTPQDTAADGRPVLDFANTFNVDKTFRAAATANGYQSNGATHNFVSESIPGLVTTPQMTGYRNIETQNFEPNSQITVPASQTGVSNQTALANKPSGYGATEHYLKNLYFDWTASNGSTTDIIAGTYLNNGVTQNTQGFFRYVNHGLRENDIVWLTIGPNASQDMPALSTTGLATNQLYFVLRIDADRFALKNFVDARTSQTIPGTAPNRSTISQNPNPVIVTRVGTSTVATLICNNTANSTTLTTTNTAAATVVSLGYGDFNNNLPETPTFEGSGATYTITPGMYVAGDQQADTGLRTSALAAYNRVTSISSNTVTLRTAVAAANTNRRFYFFRMFGLFMFQEAASEPIDRNSATKINRLVPPSERFIMNNHYLPDNTRVCLVRLPGFTTVATAQRLGSATAGSDISGNIIQEIDATQSGAITLGDQIQPEPSTTTRAQHPLHYNILINGSNVYYLRRIGTTEDNNEVTGKNLNTGISQIPNGPILSIEGTVDGNFLMLPIVDNPRANQIYIQDHGFQDNFLLQYNINNPGTIANNLIRGTSYSNTAVRTAFTNGTSYYIKRVDANYIQLKTGLAESTLVNIVSSGSNASVNTLHRWFNVAQANPTRDTIYIAGHSISSGTPIQYNAPLGETAVGGLQSGETYYVDPINNDRIRLKTSPTATTFVDLTSSGTGEDHEVVDQSSVGSVDGVYSYNVSGGSDTELKFSTNSTINGKKLAFDPTKVVDCFISGFLIPNHGFLSGTIVTYKNPNGSNDIVPLTADAQYKVVKLSNNAFGLTDLSGTPIVLTSPGSNSSPNQPHQFISSAVSGEITGPGMINLSFSAKEFNSASSAVVDIGSDSITITGHGYFTSFSAVAVKYDPGTNTPVGGLTPGQIYFVGRAVNKPGRNDANDFSLYRTANAAQSQDRRGIVDLTTLGTGTHKLVTGSTIVNLLSTGQVLPVFKGNWATGTVYQHGDIVQYRGEYFIAQNYTANINPTTSGSNVYPFEFEDATTSTYNQNKAWKKLNTPLGPEPKFLQNFKVGDTIRISLDYPQQTTNGISRIALSGTTVIIADDRFSTGTNLGGHGLVIGESIKLIPHRMPIVGTAQAAQTIITTVTPGGGYTTHPTVTFSPPVDAQTPTTATGNVRTRLQYVEITNGGSGYTSNPTVTISNGGTGGTAPTATAVVEGGQVVAVNISSEGANMPGIPTVSFTGGGGTGAVAYAVVKVQDIVITGAGAGYHEPPIITFSEPAGSPNVTPVAATGTTKLHTPFIGIQDNLNAQQIYYARPISNAQFELYNSREDAETGSNKIDIQSTGSGDIVWTRRYRSIRFDPTTTTAPAVPIYPDAGQGYMDYANYLIKFSGVHGMATGDQVVYNSNFNVQALDGLTNYNTYYVRAPDLNSISLHPTRADALANTNAIQFTNSGISGAQIHFLNHRVFQETFQTRVTGITTNNNLFLQDLPTVGLVNCEYTIPTSIYARPDGYTLHRPFDGGIEMTTSAAPYSKIVRQTRRYFRYQSGKGIQTSVAINFNPVIEIESITSVGTLATVTTRRPHGLNGSVRTVTISDALTPQGTSDPQYNGTFTATSTGLRTFTYTMQSAPASNTAYGFPVANVTKGQPWGSSTRTGMMDDQNGFYFEYDGEKLYCCKRSSVQQLSGSARVTFGSSEVVGTGCQFTKQVDVSGTIVIRGQTYIVTKIVDDNTLFIQPEYRGSTRERVSITKVETTKIPQEKWNLDVCDGSGPTGYILDVNKIQMCYMDYSWYGAGKIRFGFKDDDGKVRYVHEFKHNNRRYESYLRSGNLPARYEIEAGADPQYIPTLFHWGTSVIMDGRFDDDKAYLITAGSDDLSIAQTAAGLFIPLVTLRLAPSVDSSLTGALGDRDVINRMQVQPNQLSLLSSQAAQIFFFLNGQLTAPNFSSAGAPSLSQIIRHSGVPTADGIVGGVPIFESRVQANQQTTIDLTRLIDIGNSIMGGDQVYPNGPDILTVAVRYKTLSAAATVSATLSWTESQA